MNQNQAKEKIKLWVLFDGRGDEIDRKFKAQNRN